LILKIRYEEKYEFPNKTCHMTRKIKLLIAIFACKFYVGVFAGAGDR